MTGQPKQVLSEKARNSKGKSKSTTTMWLTSSGQNLKQPRHAVSPTEYDGWLQPPQCELLFSTMLLDELPVHPTTS